MKLNKTLAALSLTLAFGANAEGTNKIFNGYDVDPDAFDNVVHLFSKNGGSCTGTVIGTEYILTAAHCLELVNGAPLQQHIALQPGVTTAADTWVVNYAHMHDDYFNPNTAKEGINDIAIYGLEKPVEVRNFFEIKTTDTNEDRMFALGYDGRVDLRQGTQPIMDHNVYPLFADVRMLGQTVYHGDSGGPNLVEENGELKQIGVTSAGDCSAYQSNGQCVLGSVLNHYPAATFYDNNFEYIAGIVQQFHFAASQVTDASGDLTMKIQSIYDHTENIRPTVKFTGRAGAPTASQNHILSGSCTTMGALTMGEVCELVISNSMGMKEYGEIDLGNGQTIYLNKPNEVVTKATVNKNYVDIHGNQTMTLPTDLVPAGHVIKPGGGTMPTPDNSNTSNNTPNNTPSPINVNTGGGDGGGSTGLLFGALLAAAALRKKFL